MDTTQNVALPEHELDGFALDVNEVAQLLGVTRTRVSQLTTAGVLPAERKKVGTRNRLYYKRSDVLNYQHHFFNRLPKPHHVINTNQPMPGTWNSADRAGASIQPSDEDILSYRMPRQLQSSFVGAENLSVGQNLSSAIGMIRRRLDKLANQPLVAAEWHSKESMIFESIAQLFQALKQLDSQFFQTQELQQKSLDEIACIKKSLSHLHHTVLAQIKKPNLHAAQHNPTPSETHSLCRPMPQRTTLKTAGFRSSVKKRFSLC